MPPLCVGLDFWFHSQHQDSGRFHPELSDVEAGRAVELNRFRINASDLHPVLMVP